MMQPLRPQLQRLGVVFLETAHAQFALLQRADPVRTGQGGPHRRHDRYPLGERGIANAHFVLTRNFSTRSVDDKFDVAIFYEIENVRTTFPELENFRDWNFRGRQHVECAGGGNDSEPKPHKFTHDWDNSLLIAVLYADENVSARGQRWRGSHLRFCIGKPKIDIHSHDFAGRFHLGAERNIYAFIT